MKRKIIAIDEDLCNGCGACVTACAEGALQIIDGKARLVKEQFCDGFGDCIGECPTGALVIRELEAPEYDAGATRRHVAETGGAEASRRFDDAAKQHAMKEKAKHMMGHAGGCPGSMMRSFGGEETQAAPASGAGLPSKVNLSELRQWPVQIHLVQPGAPFFKNRELVVMSTCGPLASADVHWRFLRGRSVVVGCPKLDDTSGYAEKLAAILSEPSIPKVVVVRMEVPCCGGLTAIVQEAAQMSGRRDLAVEEVTIGLQGDILETQLLAK
jgi:NAD-dependent dihydropyrimidine dehydrogenase PreA subunit